MNGLISEQQMITAHNLANGYDMFIGRLCGNLLKDPQNWEYWEQEIEIARANKRYAQQLAELERIQI